VNEPVHIPDEEVVALDGVELLPSCRGTEPACGPPHNASGSEQRRAELSRLQTAVVSISVVGIRRLVSAGTTVVDQFASSPPVRYVGDIAGEIATALADDSGVDWRRAGDRAETEVARLFAVVIPVVVDSIDVADIIDRIDVNAVIERVDLNAILGSVDLDALFASVNLDELIARVDIDAVIERVDLNAILGSVDLDALFASVNLDELIARVDIDAVIERVDLNAILGSVDLDALFASVNLDELIARVDIDAVIERVDIAEISERIRVWNMVAKSTGAAAGSVVDAARDQGSALDAIVGTTLDRMRRQDPNTRSGE
jgi:hypothetical protein